MNNQNRLTFYIIGALVLGIVAGYLMNTNMPEASAKAAAEYLGLVSFAFLRLIKMIIAPLVFSTLVVGIARMGDAKTVGRIGGKAMLWFILASIVSLSLGLVLVNLFQPGVGMPPPTGVSDIATTSLTWKGFIEHLIPSSIVDGMSKNEILQIVVFSLFFGIAAAAVGKVAEPLIAAIDGVAHIMLKVTGYVMKLAPIAVFAAVSAIVAKNGLGVLAKYGIFMGEFYLGIGLLWLLLIGAGAVVLRSRILGLLRELRGPTLLAFSTASSEAAYPKTLEGVERFGVPNRIASFVLPLGYSFNLDGSMMYCTFASIFIAQAYGIAMPLGTQLLMMAILMLTSKGMAGVPRASLVVIAATLDQFAIPAAGMVLLLGIDHFLDMARSATNVIGNGIATAVVAKWEGELADTSLQKDPAATALV